MFRLLSRDRYKDALERKGYDDLFHLSLVLDLSDGSRVILEKNETVQLKRYVNRPDTTAMQAGKPGCSLYEFVQKGVDYQGASFWEYDPVSNNCQSLVATLLNANGLMTPALRDFVLQDVKSIFDAMPPWLETISRRVTSIAGHVRRLIDKFWK